MATPFESSTSGIAVMALSALVAATGSTGELTHEATDLEAGVPDTSSAPRSLAGSADECGVSAVARASLSPLCEHRRGDQGLSTSRGSCGARDLDSMLEDGSEVPSPFASFASLLPFPGRGLASTLVSEEAPLVSPLEGSLAARARYLVAHPHDEAALGAVCAALRDGGQSEALIGALEMGSDAERGEMLADHVMAELMFRIAKAAPEAHARELCRAALDRDPVHAAALSLFEQLADAAWTDELCARYQLFLEDAPLHGLAPDLCEAVTRKLAEAQRETSAKHAAFDDVEHLARVYASLYTVPPCALSRGLPEDDGVAERPSTSSLLV